MENQMNNENFRESEEETEEINAVAYNGKQYDLMETYNYKNEEIYYFENLASEERDFIFCRKNESGYVLIQNKFENELFKNVFNLTKKPFFYI